MNVIKWWRREYVKLYFPTLSTRHKITATNVMNAGTYIVQANQRDEKETERANDI